MPWLDAGKDYALGIEAGKLVCLQPRGQEARPRFRKSSRSPSWPNSSGRCASGSTTTGRSACARVEMWMLRRLLPVPCDVVRAVWPDPDWSDMFRNLVVTPADAQGRADATQTGLFRDIDAKKGSGVVDRDGETQWIATAQILIPHPILIDGLADLREIAVDLGFSQAIEQLFRPTFAATKEQLDLSRIMDFSGGRFEQLNFASSTCRQLGYPVRGVCLQQDLGERRAFGSASLVGDDSPESETYTGELIFVGADQKPLGSPTWAPSRSARVRMASQIYAKRKVEKAEEGGRRMSTAPVQLNAGGLLLSKTKVDADATEQVVARTYRHPALGQRPVIRLASDRLGEAEDLAMEFLGFEAPAVSAPIAVQRRAEPGLRRLGT